MKIYERIGELKAAVDEGWVSARRHAALPLTIYNYTPRAVYARHWPQVVREARGLILSDVGHIVARPFEKFFNLEEEIAAGTPLPPVGTRRWIYEKADGFLVIAAAYEGKRIIATRGSFTSPHALAAATWLNRRAPNWLPEPNLTHLFEGTFKDFRVVVDYPKDNLVHLGAIIKDTGVFIPPVNAWVSWADRIDQLHVSDGEPPEKILESRSAYWCRNDDNLEGYVVYWPVDARDASSPRGFRVKIKLPQYVEKHRARFRTTPWTIWAAMASNAGRLDLKPMTEMLGALPKDLQEQALDYMQYLGTRRKDISTALVEAIRTIVAACPEGFSRADRAHVVLNMSEALADSSGLPAKFLQSMAFAWFKAPNAIETLARMEHAIWKLLEPAKGDTF